MTGGQSADRTDTLRAVVSVCAFGGVLLFMWAAARGGAGFVLAIGLWLVGGVLSFGLDEETVDAREGERRSDSQPGAPLGGETAGAKDRTAAEALETARERYAGGELTEAEFERRVERLLASDGSTADDEALRVLRERYARGDLTDEQFDRKLARLTETRTLEDATDAYDRERSNET